jgi:hypothetical protein
MKKKELRIRLEQARYEAKQMREEIQELKEDFCRNSGITPSMAARVFSAWSADKQAEFLEYAGHHVKNYDAEVQFAAVRSSRYFLADARRMVALFGGGFEAATIIWKLIRRVKKLKRKLKRARIKALKGEGNLICTCEDYG